MKYLCNIYLIYITMVFLFDNIISHRQLYPNLPMGEYRAVVKFVLKCNETSKSDLEYNLRVNKKSSKSSELVGNLSFKVPFDDSISVNINWALKDLIGGWKENAHILKIAKGCTGSKAIMNNLWPIIMNAFGMNTNCPISPGTYVLKGFDLSNITSSIIGVPSFFYGSYKVRISFSDKYNNIRGCLLTVCEVRRPWEME